MTDIRRTVHRTSAAAVPVPTAQVPTTQVRRAQVRTAQVPTTQVPTTQVRTARVGGVALLAVGLLAGCASLSSGGTGTPGGTTRPAASSPRATTGPSSTAPRRSSPSAAAPTLTSGNDPSRYAAAVTASARRARVTPQLLMAILYNESDKPHDPQLERAWLQFKPDAALGVADMHRATFDETKQGRSFARRDWQELPDDPALAIEAAAWYLHDLAGQLPAHRTTKLTRDELLALGYNAGPGNMRAFARGVTPGPQATAYLQRLRDNWTQADTALRSGAR